MKANRQFIILWILLGFLGIIPLGIARGAEPIVWHKYKDAMSLGEEKQKKILLHFYADWCIYCRKMAKETFENAEVVSYIKKYFIAARINIDKDKQTTSRYFVRAVPSTVFLTETGKGIKGFPGFVPPSRLIPILKQVSALPAEN